MILSTQTETMARQFGMEPGIRVLAAAGFDALDFTMEDALRPEHPLHGDDGDAWAERMRQAAADCGVVFNQAHAPMGYAGVHDLAVYAPEVVPLMKRMLRYAGRMGVKTLVIHPIHYCACGGDRARCRRENMRFYGALLPDAEKYGVRIATENMWNIDRRRGYIIDDTCSCAEEMAQYVDEMDSPFFTTCLDLGHCGLVGREAQDMLRALGARVGALHVHDNDYIHDSHTAPFLGKMDWNAITQALADIHYAGDFTFEADNFYRGYDAEMLPEAAGFLCATGRHLIAKVNAAREK